MSRIMVLTILSLFCGLVGCGNAAEPSPSPAPSPGAEASAAPSPAPSGEDWCGEHAVPESACTRCDPSLIPAFKATKDWCEEHELPESQCLKCNPDLKIERPPKPGAK